MIHEIHDVEPTTVNKDARWEATQHFLVKYPFNFTFLFIISIFFLHALGTMHELSGGVHSAFSHAVFILEKKKKIILSFL